jgi:hypothetical protein
VLAVVSVLAVVACSGQEDGPLATPVELAGPGTPLPDGFVVPAGTRLVGPVGPGDAVGGTGWSAELYVDGDAEAAMNEVVDELVERQLQLRGECAPQRERGFAKACAIGAARIEDGFVRERVSLALEQSVPDAAEGYASTMRISYGRWPPGVLAAQYVPGRRPFHGLGSFPEPSPAPAIPGVDEPMPQSPWTDDQVFRVVPGTRVVVPVRTLDVCNGGFRAHLQVTGDLEEVVAETRRRFLGLSGIDDTTVERDRVDGHEWVRVVGGNDASARMEVRVGDAGEPTWAVVTYCTD